jgi:2-polyprenyl-6-methoxyphenol hydroxylase-like FAD-dependent oxidoreductase
MDTDVLVVGAGPTGLMLANELTRRGARAQIIDRHSGPAQQTRAMAVQARTLEIYAKLGVAARALELGARGIGANMWAEGRRMARIPVGDIGKNLSPFPFVLMLGQDDNELLLGDALRASGTDVQWNTELVGIAQKSDHVAATLKQPDGSTRTLTAAYVAGCDGARSAVRDLNGIAFPGAPYEHVFFVADTQVTGGMIAGEVNVYLLRNGFHLLFPMRGTDHWRVIGILPEALRGTEGVTFDDVIPSLRHEAGAELAFQGCSWFSTYRIHHRCAARFRDGRCFLLGDAAHVHSPMGGQGMNTGLQDAYNLGWKLALVVAGHADAALLESYEAERIPVAERLLSTTDRAFSLVVSERWIAGLFRTRILARIAAFAMTFEGIQRLAFRTLSQTGIRYPDSPLSSTLPELPAGAPRAGDRFAWTQLRFEQNGPIEDLFEKLDDTRFNLLVFGQSLPSDAAPGYDDLLRIHQVSDCADNTAALAAVHIPRPSFYLLRPDGHVGLAGTRFSAAHLAEYLNRAARLKPMARRSAR